MNWILGFVHECKYAQVKAAILCANNVKQHWLKLRISPFCYHFSPPLNERTQVSIGPASHFVGLGTAHYSEWPSKAKLWLKALPSINTRR